MKLDTFCLHFGLKGDTLEASKSAHPFELNTVKPMHCQAFSGSCVQAMPAFQKTSALYMVLKQRVGRFPI